jgi:hypothetical protein
MRTDFHPHYRIVHGSDLSTPVFMPLNEVVICQKAIPLVRYISSSTVAITAQSELRTYIESNLLEWAIRAR